MNRPRSRGYKVDPPVLLHPLILVGAGEMLTPEFKEKWSISHVINCAEDEICPTWFKQSYPDKYVYLDAIDSLAVNILSWYPRFREILQTYMRDTSCTRIFVHCQCGINRSMFLALMFVCDVLGYEFFNTEKSIIQSRPCALTNPVFKAQIKHAILKRSV